MHIGRGTFAVAVALTMLIAVSPAEAARTGVIEFTMIAPTPAFPCVSCVSSLSGTGFGAIHASRTFTAAPGAISGQVNYFDPNCPPLTGSGDGSFTLAMKDGSKPALLTFSFHAQRTGAAIVFTGSGVVRDSTGANATPLSGTAVAVFVAKPSAHQLFPPCKPAPLTIRFVGVLALS